MQGHHLGVDQRLHTGTGSTGKSFLLELLPWPRFSYLLESTRHRWLACIISCWHSDVARVTEILKWKDVHPRAIYSDHYHLYINAFISMHWKPRLSIQKWLKSVSFYSRHVRLVFAHWTRRSARVRGVSLWLPFDLSRIKHVMLFDWCLLNAPEKLGRYRGYFPSFSLWTFTHQTWNAFHLMCIHCYWRNCDKHGDLIPGYMFCFQASNLKGGSQSVWFMTSAQRPCPTW